MHTRMSSFIVGAAWILVLVAGPVAAQDGVLSGRVIDAETGGPVSQAQIQILGGGESRGSTSNAQGLYQADLPPGTYDVVVENLGYVGVRFENIGVSAGETTAYDITLTSVVLALDGIVVSASRSAPEKSTEAPATTHIVSSVEIGERPTPTMADHLRSAPGVDVITTGLQGTNVVVRGFNNIFSGALHMLTDHRLAGVPSLRVNQMHWLPTTDEDVERMEVVLGPGSALYGPNTANGIVHVLTKSPLTSRERASPSVEASVRCFKARSALPFYSARISDSRSRESISVVRNGDTWIRPSRQPEWRRTVTQRCA